MKEKCKQDVSNKYLKGKIDRETFDMIDVSMTYIHTLSTEWPEWAYSGHPNKCAAYFNDLI